MDYLEWQSTIGLKDVFAGRNSFSHPTMIANEGLVYLTSLKEEKSRSVLMFLANGDQQAKCITPKPFSLQTKVNEYGGKPYWVSGSQVCFANALDQNLYLQDISQLKTPPTRLSQASENALKAMFTDVHLYNERFTLAICEQESEPENLMSIVAIDGHQNGQVTRLIDGADFYNNVVLNASKTQMAWVQWQHPNMPWDDNECWLAELDASDNGISVVSKKRIEMPQELGINASFCQLLFADNGDLFFSADFQSGDSISTNKTHNSSSNFWNVYAYRQHTQEIQQITKGTEEHGYPHWVYGDQRLVQLDSQRLLSIASAPEGDALIEIDLNAVCQDKPVDNLSKCILKERATYQHLSSDGQGNVSFIKLQNNAEPTLRQLSISRNDIEDLCLVGDEESDVDLNQLSQSQHIAYPTSDGHTAYGFYYAPTNLKYANKTNTQAKPPLLVMVHGGPTARAYGHYDKQKQFWTSRGFAILDVNHRGSSGYGRAYRDALYGEWGIRDTQDIIDGIDYLIEQQKVDPSRVCIRGKSAGGYAVLRALTEFPDRFKAGACYYGIGNLVTLAETTHKFEKHYTDRLIGETFDAQQALEKSSQFYLRSPINKIDQVGSAMIIFQGSMDKVVPPSVAEEVVNALKSADLEYEYVEYPDEAHGFRQVVNNIDAWSKELAFYQRILSTQ